MVFFYIHLCMCISSPFLLLSDIPLYEYTTTYSFFCWWTFGLFKIMNKATVNTIVQIYVWIYIFISAGKKYLGVELLHHKVGVHLIFVRKDLIVLHTGCTILHSYPKGWDMQSLLIVSSICCWNHLSLNCSSGCLVIPHSDFNLHFPNNQQ